jgi:ATP-dependent RNA helicase DeaD
MLIYIERIIKQKINVEKLPEVKHVIEFKKKRLINNLKELILSTDVTNYIDLAKELLELADAEKIVSALLKESYNTEFDEEHYTDVKEDVRINSNT